MNPNLPTNNLPGFNNQAGIPVYGNNKPVSFLSRDNLFNIATIAVFVATIIFNRIIGLEIFVWVIAPVTGVNTAYKMYINDFLRNLIILSVPVSTFFILALLNKVTFKDGKFFNKSGQDLSNRLPVKFGSWWNPCSFIGVGIFIISTEFISIDDDNFFLMFFLISAGISLSYFVICNCPMSILINSYALKESKKVFGAKIEPYDSSRDYYTNPSYRHLPGNIYNNNRR